LTAGPTARLAGGRQSSRGDALALREFRRATLETGPAFSLDRRIAWWVDGRRSAGHAASLGQALRSLFVDVPQKHVPRAPNLTGAEDAVG
jgi:hypothetical protein